MQFDCTVEITCNARKCGNCPYLIPTGNSKAKCGIFLRTISLYMSPIRCQECIEAQKFYEESLERKKNIMERLLHVTSKNNSIKES